MALPSVDDGKDLGPIVYFGDERYGAFWWKDGFSVDLTARKFYYVQNVFQAEAHEDISDRFSNKSFGINVPASILSNSPAQVIYLTIGELQKITFQTIYVGNTPADSFGYKNENTYLYEFDLTETIINDLSLTLKYQSNYDGIDDFAVPYDATLREVDIIYPNILELEGFPSTYGQPGDSLIVNDFGNGLKFERLPDIHNINQAAQYLIDKNRTKVYERFYRPDPEDYPPADVATSPGFSASHILSDIYPIFYFSYHTNNDGTGRNEFDGGEGWTFKYEGRNWTLVYMSMSGWSHSNPENPTRQKIARFTFRSLYDDDGNFLPGDEQRSFGFYYRYEDTNGDGLYDIQEDWRYSGDLPAVHIPGFDNGQPYELVIEYRKGAEWSILDDSDELWDGIDPPTAFRFSIKYNPQLSYNSDRYTAYNDLIYSDDSVFTTESEMLPGLRWQKSDGTSFTLIRNAEDELEWVADLEVAAGTVADDSISTNKIQNHAVTFDKLSDSLQGRIGGEVELTVPDGGVTTPKLADDAVTNDKLAGSVKWPTQNRAGRDFVVQHFDGEGGFDIRHATSQDAVDILNSHTGNVLNGRILADGTVIERQLSADLQEKINADGGSTTDLTPYRTSADQDVIDNAQNSVIADKADASDIVTTFEGLTDTPASLRNSGGKLVAVNSAANALEFVDAPSGGGGGSTLVATYRAESWTRAADWITTSPSTITIPGGYTIDNISYLEFILLGIFSQNRIISPYDINANDFIITLAVMPGDIPKLQSSSTLADYGVIFTHPSESPSDTSNSFRIAMAHGSSTLMTMYNPGHQWAATSGNYQIFRTVELKGINVYA